MDLKTKDRAVMLGKNAVDMAAPRQAAERQQCLEHKRQEAARDAPGGARGAKERQGGAGGRGRCPV